MPFWDALRSSNGAWTGTDWNPTPGQGQRNDYSIPLQMGTPVESPVSGIVLPQHTNGGGVYSYYGKQVWGGEADILTFLPKYGGLVDVNILHFNTLNVQPGDVVVKGQTVLGTSGGQNSGGTMPSSPTYSTGPHIGVGVHAVDNWDRMYDPKPLLSDLLAGQDTSSVPAQTQIQGSGLGWLPRGGTPSGVPLSRGTGGVQTGPGGPITNIIGSIIGGITGTTSSQWQQSLLSLVPRIGKFVLGMVFIGIGVSLFIAGAFIPDIGAAAATAAGIPEAAEPIRGALSRQKVSGSIRSGIRAEGALRNKERLRREHAAAAAENRRTAQEASDRTGAAVANAMHGFFVRSGARGGHIQAARREAGLPTRAQERAARRAQQQPAAQPEPLPGASMLPPHVLEAYRNQFGHEPNPASPEEQERLRQARERHRNYQPPEEQ